MSSGLNDPKQAVVSTTKPPRGTYKIIPGGDATTPIGAGPKIVPHVCNTIGAWGAGFVVSLSRKWKEPEQAYRQWHRSGTCNVLDYEGGIPFVLGQIQIVSVAPDLYVANMIGQEDIGTIAGQRPPIRYGAVVKCMYRLSKHAERLRASIHCPKFGSKLAGGNWEIIEQMIQEIWVDQGLNVTVYDFDAKR